MTARYDSAPDTALIPLGSPATDVPADLVELGRIADPYGVRGWVNIHAYSDDPAVLRHAKRWYISRVIDMTSPFAPTASAAGADSVHCVQVAQSKMHSGRVVAQLQGCDDRSMAERLKGLRISVSRADFPAPKKGEFYWVDLVGLAVINRENLQLGTVTEVTDHGAHPILGVMPADGGEELLIPFVPVYIDSVSLVDRVIRVDWQPDY